MTEHTPTMERLRAEYIEMRAQQFGFSDLYAQEWDRALAAHDAEVRSRAEAVVAMSAYDDGFTAGEAAVRAGVVTEEPEGFYIIPNRDAPDQDSLWDGTIHPTREAAQASLDDAVREWGQDVENYHVVAMVPVGQGDEG